MASVLRSNWVWLGTAPLSALFYAAGSWAEAGAVIAALCLLVGGLLRPRQSRLLAVLASVLLVAATASLVAHLLADDFAYRYVWLYSGAALPWYLKLSNLWGGDEGTLLLMATLTGLMAAHLTGFGRWAGAGALLVSAAFALGAVIWSPFGATPAADLAAMPSRGMNAHLISVWMAFHPPQIFAAFACFLAPAGAALAALAKGDEAWRPIATVYVRLGWLILSFGLATGMWWAYEDFSFGQIWHWDPVQTSVFVVWALASAHMHCLRRYRTLGMFARTHPVLGLLTGIACLLAMVVTRSPKLVSSHRYVGESSLPLLAAGAVLLLLAVFWALWRGRRRVPRTASPRDESNVLIWIATALLATCGAVALVFIGHAYASAYLELPRPEELKPFFETLARWSRPEELAELKAAFAQWDIDNFGLNRWLAPLAVCVGLVGGHYFAAFRWRRHRWSVSAGVAAIALASALWLHPAAMLFRGIGMTSGQTVAIFPWLDALVVTAAYLLAGAVIWLFRSFFGRRRTATGMRYAVPLGAIHLGVMIALIGGLSATVLDSYAQKLLRYPDDFGTPQRFPDGFTVTVWLGDAAFVDDGGRGASGAGAFRSVAEVAWSLEQAGSLVQSRSGHTVYRDDRAPTAEGQGPVRLMCEILDYRYARYVSRSKRMIHPFIHRGLLRDVQLWFPAVDHAPETSAAPGEIPEDARQPSHVPVILKTYPLLSWVWIGLALSLIGALFAAIFELRGRRRVQPDAGASALGEAPLEQP